MPPKGAAAVEIATSLSGMKGVLIGLAGRNADTLRIRPPLPFGRQEADLLLEKLDLVLHG